MFEGQESESSVPWSQGTNAVCRLAALCQCLTAVARTYVAGAGPRVERLVEEAVKVREGVEGLVNEAGKRHYW